MRLKRFSVENYRSIRSTPRIDVGKNLTIIGPNNEGKSNVVRALVTALRILEEHSRSAIGLGGLLGEITRRPAGAARALLGSNYPYEFSSDCHVEAQTRNDAKSVFYLEFHLDDEDIDEFHEAIGSAINEFLPIQISIGREGKPEFEVKKQGKAKKVLQRKSVSIAKFVGSRLSINHIAAIRTADEAIQAVSSLASTTLRRVQSQPEYREALQVIEELQRPIYEELEQQLTDTLQRFLPNVHQVTLGVTSSSAARALRAVDILIDDGQFTPLKNKGDGVISLVGMALLARLRESSGASFNTVLAIEEPESHLHPKAIHSIREVLDNIGDDYQVIVTTHSPVLVDRLNMSANVIVENSKARIARDVSEIREALGVKVSDSLSHARLVIVCEGADDEGVLKRALRERSPIIETALRSADLSFYPLKGSGNLSYAVAMLQQAIAEPVCILDDDQSGRAAADKAVVDELIHQDEVVLTSVLGKRDAELEDLLDQGLVRNSILRRFTVDITAIPAGLRRAKFSERCAAAFANAGAPWNDSIKAAAKVEVNKAALTSQDEIIEPGRSGPVDRLVSILEKKLGQN
jgi:hypothetical protein